MTTRNERFYLLVVAITVVAVVLASLFLMFATSMKGDEQQILRDLGNAHAFWVWPQDISLTNFQDVLSSTTFPVLRYMWISAIIVVSIVVVGIFVNSLAAFALSRMVAKVGWVDTYRAQIVPFIAYPFSIFLFYQIFLRSPRIWTRQLM